MIQNIDIIYGKCLEHDLYENEEAKETHSIRKVDDDREFNPPKVKIKVEKPV